MRVLGLLGASCLLVLQISARSLGSTSSRSHRREIPSTHSIHEQLAEGQPRAWLKKDKVSSSHTLPMRVGLKQSNLEEGHNRLMDM